MILGHTAKSQIRQTNEEGDGMATVGIVLGWMGIVWWAFLWFAVMLG